ncbi:hypothetical protein BDF21DRAFT_352065, partial [Thamnidium elegans]
KKQPVIVKEAEATLSGTKSKSVNLEKFTRYVKTRATVSSALYGYYGNESQKPAEVYFPGSSLSFLLPFRKLKFSSKLFYDQDDNKLVDNLRGKFGQDAILVFGDWSAPNTKFHKPTRNISLISMLKKNGFTVYLVNEYKTSSFCPRCEHALETFKAAPNPRPFKRAEMPTVTCHGLLWCKNTVCIDEGKRKLWNRDQAAALNFKKILLNLREVEKRLQLFSRK